ncbi:MAG TPA: hypothetical protein PLX07_03125, partial [Microthrixaceae bacterium]|nr:hypothetical protein [Microthrixaceae bacterium]
AVVGIGALLVFLVMDQPSAGAVLWIAIGALVVLAIIEILGRSARTAPAATEGADSDASVGASGATPLESGEVPEHV